MSRLFSLNFGYKHQLSRQRIMRGMKVVRANRLKLIPLLPAPSMCSEDEKLLGGTSNG